MRWVGELIVLIGHTTIAPFLYTLKKSHKLLYQMPFFSLPSHVLRLFWLPSFLFCTISVTQTETGESKTNLHVFRCIYNAVYNLLRFIGWSKRENIFLDFTSRFLFLAIKLFFVFPSCLSPRTQQFIKI